MTTESDKTIMYYGNPSFVVTPITETESVSDALEYMQNAEILSLLSDIEVSYCILNQYETVLRTTSEIPYSVNRILYDEQGNEKGKAILVDIRSQDASLKKIMIEQNPSIDDMPEDAAILVCSRIGDSPFSVGDRIMLMSLENGNIYTIPIGACIDEPFNDYLYQLPQTHITLFLPAAVCDELSFSSKDQCLRLFCSQDMQGMIDDSLSQILSANFSVRNITKDYADYLRSTKIQMYQLRTLAVMNGVIMLVIFCIVQVLMLLRRREEYAILQRLGSSIQTIEKVALAETLLLFGLGLSIAFVSYIMYYIRIVNHAMQSGIHVVYSVPVCGFQIIITVFIGIVIILQKAVLYSMYRLEG